MFGLDKVALQIIGVIVLVFLLIGGYYWWKWGVEKDAMKKWNDKQIELVQQENQKVVENLNKINEDAKALNRELEAENAQLHKRLDGLKAHVRSPEVRKQYQDKPASDVLKRVIKELSR